MVSWRGPKWRRQLGNSRGGHGGRVIPHGRHISEPKGGERSEGDGGGGDTEEVDQFNRLSGLNLTMVAI